MSPLRTTGVAAAIALTFPLAARAADDGTRIAQAALPASAPASAAAAASTAPQRLENVEITGVRQRLDAARNSLSPETGSTIYRYSRDDLAAQPLGDSTPLNQVLLQAPGVVQDSFGQLHVRGDHSNVQYRINGVVIPEAISGFGQALETRFANNVNFLTGALPAQYGYRTAAIVDIQTKGEIENGGSVGLLGGSRGYREGNGEIGGTSGAFSYFVTGTVQRSDIGIENPTPARDAIHDRTLQAHGFAYLSYVLDPSSRVSVMLGSADNRFEIPNVPGQTPGYTVAGAPPPDSASLDARQREHNRFGVVTYQGAIGSGVDYQVSLFDRWTDVHYRPDPNGDLAFYGIAADVARRNSAAGTQLDGSYRIDAAHTLRAGFFYQRETYTVGNDSLVFPADASGNQTSTTPVSIVDDTRLRGHLWGVYLQDEWQPTKALTVNYGLRYDKVNTVSDESQWSPRVGVVYDLAPTLRVHAGYSRYFTPPPTEKIDTTSVAKFAGTTNALPSDANTAVRAERSDYYDVGAAWQLTRTVTLGLDAYWRNVAHLQDEGQFGNALIFSAFNYEKGRIGGVELSASYKDKGLAAYANLALSRARGENIETGQFNFGADELAYIASHYVHLDHEQKWSASGGVSYRFADGPTLAADVLVGSGLRNGFANTEHLPGYAQWNLSAEQSVDFGGWFGKLTGRVAVVNVFDRVYEIRDGTGIGVGAPQYGPRRTFVVGVSKPF